jgi:hypothetical protein
LARGPERIGRVGSDYSPRREKIEEFADLHVDLLPGVRSIDEIGGLPVRVACRGLNSLEVFLKGDAGVDAGWVGMADPLCKDFDIRLDEDHEAGAAQDVGVPGVADGAASQGDGHPLEIRETATQGILQLSKGEPALLSD